MSDNAIFLWAMLIFIMFVNSIVFGTAYCTYMERKQYIECLGNNTIEQCCLVKCRFDYENRFADFIECSKGCVTKGELK